MTTIDVSLGGLAAVYAMVALPAILIVAFRLGLLKEGALSIVRMTVQLVLVGLYLGLLFDLNHPALNLAWVLVMIVVATTNVVRSAGLRLRVMFLPALAGVAVSTLIVLTVMIVAAVRPEPIYDARYLIPIAGMLLGNCMRGNIIALERFYVGTRSDERAYRTSIFIGATVLEATRPQMRLALRAAIGPTIATMATMGIVSLPGMMTGQILGGSDPLTAIKYQLAIMVAILVTVTLGAYLNVRMSMGAAFDDYQMLDRSIFSRSK